MILSMNQIADTDNKELNLKGLEQLDGQAISLVLDLSLMKLMLSYGNLMLIICQVMLLSMLANTILR